jgi:hypothetical protein
MHLHGFAAGQESYDPGQDPGHAVTGATTRTFRQRKRVELDENAHLSLGSEQPHDKRAVSRSS